MIILAEYIKRNALTLAMVIGAAAAIALSGFAAFAEECERVPSGVLRLHIIPNSDSEEDQSFKLELRDYILGGYAAQLSDCRTRDEALERSLELLPQIEADCREFAARYAEQSGESPPNIAAEITEMYFTTRVYGGETLPAGRYAALRLTIGEGEGGNWWCVMFPGLCLPAVTVAEEESVVAVQGRHEERERRPEVRFAVFEFFSSLFSSGGIF